MRNAMRSLADKSAHCIDLKLKKTLRYSEFHNCQWNQKMFSEEISRIDAAFAEQKEKRHALRDLDFFMLDNSIRESIVG